MTLPLRLADITQHVRMDIETYIGHVVQMFARNQPDDFADRPFGKMAG
jgi:hypothetical protein